MEITRNRQDPEMYKRLVGRLLYLNLTRADIAYDVQQLSQFVQQPHSDYWHAALHLLRYLKGTPQLGLFYSSTSDFQLRSYSDSDWGSCHDSGKSLIGYCVFLGSCLVSWKIKKQTIISRSSAKAEYRALASTTCELLWIDDVSQDFGFNIVKPIRLFCDNQAASHIVQNPIFHERTKHLDIDCHIVRNKFKEDFLQLEHVSTKLQLADILTKQLGVSQIRLLLSKLGMVSFV